jgi:hypothetical protein
MKKTVLSFIFLVGLYAVLRNNVFKLPGQLIWITNMDVFYKVFLPLLMSVSALFAIFRTRKQAYFNLAAGAMVIDAINRLSIGVNHFYGYLQYKDIPMPPTPPDSVMVVTNLWPSHILLFIEIILIIYLVSFLKITRGNESIKNS